MKIALVVHDLDNYRGHGHYVRVLAEALSAHHKVTVFANTCTHLGESRWDLCPVRAWRVNAVASVCTFPIGLALLKHRLGEFDILHTQGYCGGRPNVVTAHICLAAYLRSLSEISTRTWCSLRLMALAESRFYRGYRGAIIAASQGLANDLRHFYEVRGPVYVVPHGVDSDRFTSANRGRFRARIRRELGIADDQTLALYVGDLTKAHTYLKALAQITPDVRFAIVTASRQYQWSAPNVRFHEPTAVIEHFYSAADAFVFPTCYDAFAMVVLEAMASGLPVFSSDRAGAAELIDPGRDGFVSALRDWVETTSAALREVGSLLSVGRAAEETARRHDWTSVVCAVKKVYNQVVTSELGHGGEGPEK